jgi:antitoxin component of MazEF toxin-antitoxin module
MRARVQRRGDELVVVIPEEVAKEELIAEDVEVEIRRPYIVPADTMTLEEMCATITPENRHPETDWGPDVGKEIIEW